MTASQTPAQTSASVPVWGSWKTHGNAKELYYWGNTRKAADHKDGRKLTMGMEGGLLVGRNTQGKIVVHAGNAHRFWASPVVAELAEAGPVVGQKATKASNKFCLCGCETPTARGRQFRQGHDAKLVARVYKEIAANRIPVEAGMTVLPTEALRAKLARQIAAHVA